MKKYIAVAALSLSVAVLPCIAGCSSDITQPHSSSDSSISSSTSSESSTTAPEPEIPAGNPTFLICPDGTPVYTSEITEIINWSNETITIEQAEQIAHREIEDEEFHAKCVGFAYGYIPQKALNRIDNPEMFKDSGGEFFEFLGEDEEPTNECMRIEVGDKFGTLTVTSAQAEFGSGVYDKEFDDAPGAYLSGGTVVFEGKIELTGYLTVEVGNPDYPGSEGIMTFFPDGESSTKIPVVPHGTLHRRTPYSDGCFGDWCASFGRISDADFDTSGLHLGDTFVKVKVTADRVSTRDSYVSIFPKNVDVI